MIPEFFFLTKGVGKHREQLQSFELALRDAGIQYCNLVNVSSIVPAGCKMVPRGTRLAKVAAGRNYLCGSSQKFN
jgi:arginine decarboxylase